MPMYLVRDLNVTAEKGSRFTFFWLFLNTFMKIHLEMFSFTCFRIVLIRYTEMLVWGIVFSGGKTIVCQVPKTGTSNEWKLKCVQF